MAEMLRAIGLMSGTSMDGVDAALVETDGQSLVIRGAGFARSYSADERAILRAGLEAAVEYTPSEPLTLPLVEAQEVVTRVHGSAVEALLQKAGLGPAQVDLIGFHGQTVIHRPQSTGAKPGYTLQLGDGAALAAQTGIDVVSDFRVADVAAGGEGAPFAPLYHSALVGNLQRPLPLAVVNMGGVGNVTYIPKEGATPILAFDTGPANALVDDWMTAHTGRDFDEGGIVAASGKVHEDIIAQALSAEFFDRPPPKSLDRQDFGLDMVKGLSLADGAATLTAFSAAALARAAEHLPQAPKAWIICGGGRHNASLMREFRHRLNAEVLSAEDVKWRGDLLEAEAFAYLAVRSLAQLPLSLPTTTGVPRPMTGGCLHKVSS